MFVWEKKSILTQKKIRNKIEYVMQKCPNELSLYYTVNIFCIGLCLDARSVCVCLCKIIFSARLYNLHTHPKITIPPLFSVCPFYLLFVILYIVYVCVHVSLLIAIRKSYGIATYARPHNSNKISPEWRSVVYRTRWLCGTSFSWTK